jgi:hypothetical protein
MQDYTDIALYKTHQHIIVVISKVLRVVIPYSLLIFVLGNYVLEWNIFLQIIIIFVGAFCI